MTMTSSPRLTVAVTTSPTLSQVPTAPVALVTDKLVMAGNTASSVTVLLAVVTTLLPSVAVAVMVLAPALMTSLLFQLGCVTVKVPLPLPSVDTEADDVLVAVVKLARLLPPAGGRAREVAHRPDEAAQPDDTERRIAKLEAQMATLTAIVDAMAERGEL